MGPKRRKRASKSQDTSKRLKAQTSGSTTTTTEKKQRLSDWDYLEQSRGERVPEYDDKPEYDTNPDFKKDVIPAFQRITGDDRSEDVWENPNLLATLWLTVVFKQFGQYGLLPVTRLIADYGIFVLVDVQYPRVDAKFGLFGYSPILLRDDDDGDEARPLSKIGVRNCIHAITEHVVSGFVRGSRRFHDPCVRIRQLNRLPHEFSPSAIFNGSCQALSLFPGGIDLKESQIELNCLETVMNSVRPTINQWNPNNMRDLFFDHEGNRIQDPSTLTQRYIMGDLQWYHEDTTTQTVTRVL